MSTLYNSLPITSCCRTVCDVMGVPCGDAAAPANEAVKVLCDRKLEGRKADRALLYNPDAIALWLYVDNLDQSIGTTTVSNIPIEFVGESDVLAARNLMMIKAKNSTVTLELEGQRNIISRLQKKDMRVQVDLSSVTTAGTHNLVYEVIYPDSISRSSVQLKAASIYTVTVEIGQLYRRNVGIHGVIEGDVAEGYSAGDFRFDPSILEISGQEADVQKVLGWAFDGKYDGPTICREYEVK